MKYATLLLSLLLFACAPTSPEELDMSTPVVDMCPPPVLPETLYCELIVNSIDLTINNMAFEKDHECAFKNSISGAQFLIDGYSVISNGPTLSTIRNLMCPGNALGVIKPNSVDTVWRATVRGRYVEPLKPVKDCSTMETQAITIEKNGTTCKMNIRIQTAC